MKRAELKGTPGYDKYDQYQELFPDIEEAIFIRSLTECGITIGVNDIDFETASMLIEISCLMRAKDGRRN